PDLDRVIGYDHSAKLETWQKIRAEHYDWILDFQSSPRSALLVLFSGARLTAGYRVPFWGRVYAKTVPRPRGDISVVDGKLTLLEKLAGPTGPRMERRIYLSSEERR